jgi:hypothetical protein
MRRVIAQIIIVSTCSALTGSGLLAQSKAPPARYAMDVGTTTGLAALAGKGAGGALSMMLGGGANSEGRELHLRLGSPRAPDKGAPKADHFLMPAAKLGKSVPLITIERTEGSGGAASELPRDFQRPKGRLLLFWGCGEKVGKGQPIVIDFAKVAAGQIPPGLTSVRVLIDRGPSLTNSKTYGEWPNSKGGKPPGSGSSLVGEHRIVSSYAPEIKFALAQDYMPAIRARAVDLPSGAQNLTWNAVSGATGFYAWTIGMKMSGGGGGPQDLVWWSSASAREFGGGLSDWLPPETVRRLIGEKIVMPPSQTSCVVPAAVKAAAPDFGLGNLNAFGPEANFSAPRPATPAPPPGPEWTARVRYRSNTSWLIGGPQIGGAQGRSESPPCKPSIFGVLTGAGCTK